MQANYFTQQEWEACEHELELNSSPPSPFMLLRDRTGSQTAKRWMWSTGSKVTFWRAALGASGPPKSQCVPASGVSLSLSSAGAILREATEALGPVFQTRDTELPERVKVKKNQALQGAGGARSVISTSSSRHLLCLPSPLSGVHIEAFEWHHILYFAKSFHSCFLLSLLPEEGRAGIVTHFISFLWLETNYHKLNGLKIRNFIT